MQVESGARKAAPGRTRYVFAGTTDRGGEGGTKTCPRCGQVLFDDMDVCYGCLYDFGRDSHGALRAFDEAVRDPLGRLGLVPQVIDPLDGVELDEIDEDEPRVPRHSKEASARAGSPDDTLDLSATPVTQALPPVGTQPEAEPCWLVVSAPGLRVRMAVGEAPLGVGRDESNDLVLYDRSVSRRHVRIRREGECVLVEDLGATNPALLGGVPLVGSAPLGPGDELSVCGTVIALA